MLKIDDNLLQEIGLGTLPAEEKRGLLTHIYETLEMRVGMRLADQMTNEQLDEFEQYFEAKDDAGAFKWLESNFPNYKEIVNEEFEKLKGEVGGTAGQILAASQQNMAAHPLQPQIPEQSVAQPALQQYAAPQPPTPAYQPSEPPAAQPYQPIPATPQAWPDPAALQQPVAQPSYAPPAQPQYAAPLPPQQPQPAQQYAAPQPPAPAQPYQQPVPSQPFVSPQPPQPEPPFPAQQPPAGPPQQAM